MSAFWIEWWWAVTGVLVITVIVIGYLQSTLWRAREVRRVSEELRRAYEIVDADAQWSARQAVRPISNVKFEAMAGREALHIIVWLLSVIAVLLAAILAALLLLSTPGAAGDLTGSVTHVRDGDTIEVDNVAIRLQGLHAPELDEAGGAEAAAFMVELVIGQDVTCDLTGERSHDRLIGVCFLDGRDIAAELIAAGLGRDCPRYSGGRYATVDHRPDMPLPDYCR